MFTPDPRIELPCQDGSEAWFSLPGTQATARALAGCRSCPVRQDCLTETLEFEARLGYTNWGVYGGMLEKERKKLLNQGRKPHARVA